jgi:hypothetical protein
MSGWRRPILNRKATTVRSRLQPDLYTLEEVGKMATQSLVPERILNRSRQHSRLRVLRVAGLEFPLIVWTVRREPLGGLESVISELSRVLAERL